MTLFDCIPPMTKYRRILFLVYEGFDILSTTGPADVFTTANDLEGENLYEVKILSINGGAISCNAGFSILSEKLGDLSITSNDSLFIAGATKEQNLRKVLQDKTLLHGIQKTAPQCGRFGSVCTGSFLLAQAGLLEGRKAVTHWRGCADFSKYYPRTEVLADDLYVVDKEIWTSAGVTTGIDMALAMIDKDHGKELMGKVAKQLVVYAHRPGNQCQFSTALDVQLSAKGRFADVVLWIEDHLDHPLKVDDMAAQAGMSERNFYRKFTEATGKTPSKYLENIRLEKAKELLEKNLPIKRVTGKVGFRSEAGFRSAFKNRFGVSPSLHRRMHARTENYIIGTN